MPKFRRPLGLALSGGGAFGAWQAAALAALEKRFGLSFDAVVGFSAGALSGVAYAVDKMDDALARWRAIDGDVLRLSPRLFPPSLFSDKLLRGWLHYADDALARERLRCRLVVISAPRTREAPIYGVFEREGRWDAPLLDHLVASCAIPLVFPPVRLKMNGKSVLAVDGGCPCEAPISFKELSGCKDVIVLEMVRADEVGRRARGIADEFDLRSREVCRRLINQGVASLRALPEPPRVFRLAPSVAFQSKMLNFRRRHLSSALELGAKDAEAFIAASESYLET